MLDVIHGAIFPKTPFERPNSAVFIKYVKRGDLIRVIKMLDEDPFLIYQFDFVGQNILHICAKKGYNEMLAFS